MHGVVLFGRPCSGKSTIGKRFAEKYGYVYISSGDIAREMAGHDRQTGADLAAGKMAPEEMMRVNIRWAIRREIGMGNNFVLDGFPRFRDQLDYLQRTFPHLNLIYAHIWVSTDYALYRARNRGRNDDAAIQARLDYFEQNTYDLLRECKITINNNDEYDVEAKADELYKEVMRYAVNS